jgi:hypothetical protein
MLLNTSILPISWATNIEENIKNVQFAESFYNCKIVTSGKTEKQISIGMLKIMNSALAFLIEIQYGEDGESYIYNVNSGIEKWYHVGAQKLILFIYGGSLSYQHSVDGSLKTLIEGRVFFVKAEAL